MSISHGHPAIKKNLPHRISIVVLILVGFFSWTSQARKLTFWKQRVPAKSLNFISSTQSILSQLCSGATTVETQVGNISTAVSSDLTVNLLGPAGVVFYSDSACTTSISSIVIANGSSSKSFYFLAASAGTPSLSATATSYASASQSQTIGANPFIWVGMDGGGTPNWNASGNWSGGSAPGSGDIAVFSSSCTVNCSPTINVPITISGLRMGAGYTGTITQGANSVTLNGAGFTQIAGIFNGGSAAITTTGFNLAGGTFRSTSGNLTYYYGFLVTGSPIFNHNSGTVTAYSPDWALSLLKPGSVVFNNLVMSTTQWGQNGLDGSTVIVAGNLTLAGTGYGYDSGTFAVAGNVAAITGGINGGVVIKLTGNASGQTISGTSSDTFPSIEIATGANPVTFSGTVNVTGDFTITSVGTLTTTGSTLQLSCGAWADCYAVFNNKHINHLTISPDGNGQQFFTGNGAAVDGNLTISSGGYGTHGAVSVYGNVSFTAPGSGGSMSLTFLGSNSTLSVAGSTTVPAGTVTVSKTAGQTLTLNTDVAWSSGGQSLNVTSGSINMAGHNLTVAGSVNLNSNTITKSGGALVVGGSTIGSGSALGGTVNP